MNYAQSSKSATMAGFYGHGTSSRQNPYQSHTQLYTQTPPPSTDSLGYNQAAMNSLAQAFGATNLAGSASMPADKQSNGSFSAQTVNGSMVPMNPNAQFYYHQLPDGTVVMSGMNNMPANYYQYAGAYNMGMPTATNLTPHAYSGYAASASQPAWGPSQHVPLELPELAAPRRNSLSSNEGSPGPHTPFNHGLFPSSAYAYPPINNGLSPWTKPNPIQLAQQFPFEQLWRTRENTYELVDYYNITQENPAIPVAVPAKWTKDSGRGTFDKILDNEHGTTNVYIRGLHPDTTDKKLEGYGLRFGDILRCKAIIDLSTGGCKGFGFVEYHNYTDAENCIRCFYYLGYEAKFAKLSHNERLKNCADPENNNLYVSNLPKAMTESKELKALFTNVFPLFNVTSTKVLKDAQGISRGVGFVRFETHDICENVLDHFNNHPMLIGDDDTLLQLRYADSQAQKKLKEESAAHRGFKANEYNMEAFGPASPFYRSPITPIYPSPLQSSGTRSNGSWRRQTSISPGTFMASQAVLGSTQTIPTLKSQLQNVMPSYIEPSAPTHTESPCATAATKRVSNETGSIGGNTLVGSSVADLSYKDALSKTEDSSDGDQDTKATTKHESSPIKNAVEEAGKAEPSPSKANRAKL